LTNQLKATEIKISIIKISKRFFLEHFDFQAKKKSIMGMENVKSHIFPPIILITEEMVSTPK
jgi:hypothetical protein